MRRGFIIAGAIAVTIGLSACDSRALAGPPTQPEEQCEIDIDMPKTTVTKTVTKTASPKR